MNSPIRDRLSRNCIRRTDRIATDPVHCVCPYQRRSSPKTMSNSIPSNRRGSSPKRSERGDRPRGRPCGGLAVMERGMDGRMTMRMTRIGVRTRVSSFVFYSSRLKADGKQGALFRRARLVFSCFSFGCGFFDDSFIKIHHQGHTISSSMA
jgi:hypothetical protein